MASILTMRASIISRRRTTIEPAGPAGYSFEVGCYFRPTFFPRVLVLIPSRE